MRNGICSTAAPVPFTRACVCGEKRDKADTCICKGDHKNAKMDIRRKCSFRFITLLNVEEEFDLVGGLDLYIHIFEYVVVEL